MTKKRTAEQIIADHLTEPPEITRAREEEEKRNKEAERKAKVDAHGHPIPHDLFNAAHLELREQFNGDYDRYFQFQQLQLMSRIANALEGIERRMENP